MTQNLRVLRVIGHLGSGGTERQCVEVLDALSARETELGCTVDLVTFWARHHLHRPSPRTRWHQIDQPLSARGAATTAFRLARLLRREDYDCVHALLWPAATVVLPTLPRRTALLTSIHSSKIRDRPGKAALLRAIGVRTDLLVFNSAPGAQRLRSSFGVLAAQTRVQPNGKQLAPAPGPGEARSGIVCIARDVPSKRQRLLLDAWRRMREAGAPELPLTFVGRGTDSGPLGEAIERAGARGVGEVADVSPYLRRAAIAALPTDHEGMPNAVLEAWNHGAAVLASSVSGVRELVRPGVDGRLVPNQLDAWVRALSQLATDTDARASLARAGRERLEAEFSLDRVARAWVDLYHEATRVRGHGV